MDNFTSQHIEIRDRIFYLLDKRNVSQKEFSQLLGVSSQTITDWKKGKSRSFTGKLSLIAQILNTSIEWLWSGTGSEFATEQDRIEHRQRSLDTLHKAARRDAANNIKRDLARSIQNQGLTVDDFTADDDDPIIDLLLKKGAFTTMPATKAEIQAAFWGGEKDLTQEDLDAMWADVENFAAFVAQKRRQEKKND